MEERIFAAIIWLVLFFGVPLVLAIGTVSMWGDGMSAFGARPAFNNGAVLFLLVIYSVVWLLLLRLILAPGIGYDTPITNIADLFSPGYEAMPALQRLYDRLAGWLQRDPLNAGLRLGALLALLGLPLVVARVVGEQQARRRRPAPGWSRQRGYDKEAE
jgi:hypothetical protein